MFIVKKIFKTILWFFGIVIGYVLLSILISYIPVNNVEVTVEDKNTIYLHSNGVHITVSIPIENVSSKLKEGFIFEEHIKYIKFGWGDKNFYMNVPTWDQFKMKYALGAFFLDNPTLIHMEKLDTAYSGWTPVKVTDEELEKLNDFLFESCRLDEKGSKIEIVQNLYPDSEILLESKGTYSPFKTCNTWLNSGFKQSGMKASLWTLFDFGLLNKYE